MPYRGLGLKPDPYDARDLMFEATPRRFIGAIPPVVDLRDQCSPVRDQGQQGSCTGFAVGTGLREFLEIKSGNPNPMVVLSPAFIYYEERKMEGTTNEDSGAYIRDGLKVLKRIGVCPEMTSRIMTIISPGCRRTKPSVPPSSSGSRHTTGSRPYRG